LIANNEIGAKRKISVKVNMLGSENHDQFSKKCLNYFNGGLKC
jgi:hypothetical protein